MTTHLVIPDTQVKPGVNTEHLKLIGNYIVDKKPDVVIHLGDHWDMPSLSSYDRGKLQFEGRRYKADIEAGNKGFALLNKPLEDYNAKKLKHHEKQWWPRRVFLRGNHENRVSRAIEDNGVLDGTIGLDDMDTRGWEVNDFLEPVWIDGVCYSHYFYNPMSGKPYGGMVSTRLKNIGHSFTMGHQQTLDYALRFVGGKSQHGLVAGSCLTPDHKVLTADLRYVPLGEVEPGDKLVSFDESIEDSPGRTRRYKTGEVLHTKRAFEEVFAVTLDDGKCFKVTADHRWLVRVGGQTSVNEGATYQWRTTEGLRKGTKLPKMLPEWDTLKTHSSGYLAGMFDGEGCYYTRQTTAGWVGQLSLSQKPGAVLQRTEDALSELFGYEFLGTHNSRGVTTVRVKGGLPKVAHVLGSIRPTRLLSKFAPEHLGGLTTSENHKVVSIEKLGVEEIVRIDIDAKTMIVEGYPHHNCYTHTEDYKGPQGNDHWRGIIMKHEVREGSYDPMFVSLNYLFQRYKGHSVDRYMKK